MSMLSAFLAMPAVTVTGTPTAVVAAVVLAGAMPFVAMGFLIAPLVAPGAGPAILHLLDLPSRLGMPLLGLPHWVEVLTRAPPAGDFAHRALAALGLAPAGDPALHSAVHGGLALLMLSAGWITLRRREANTR